MVRIAPLRTAIADGVAAILAPRGFTRSGAASFWREAPDVLQGVTITFLDRSHAARFNSTTASFGLELGVYYTFVPRIQGGTASLATPPAHHECHIRRVLRRRLCQIAPPSGYSMAHRFRRDIWWVRPDGANLTRVIRGAQRQVRRHAPPWLERFSDLGYAVRYLQTRRATPAGEPFNLGRIGCPYRLDLIARLTERSGG